MSDDQLDKITIEYEPDHEGEAWAFCNELYEEAEQKWKTAVTELREIAREHPEFRKYLGITIRLVDWGINKAKRALLNEETKRKRRTKKGS